MNINPLENYRCLLGGKQTRLSEDESKNYWRKLINYLNSNDSLIRFNSLGFLSLGNRKQDRWGLQVYWPRISFAKCFDRIAFSFQCDTTLRLNTGKGYICFAISVLGFGFGIYLAKNSSIDLT